MEINPGESSAIAEGPRTRDIVSELVQRSFSSRSIVEQKAIVRLPRPTPMLTLKTRNRSFQQSWYEKKDWLCASEAKQRLFCWPCLLFRPKSTTWTHTGYVNMHNLLGDCQKHENAKTHIEAYFTWKTFERDDHQSVDVMFSRARREAIERYNEEVKQNREMLNNIIEAVLYLAKQELAFRGHDESSTSLNQGNYRELLKSFGKMDSVFDRRLHRRLHDSEAPDTGGVFTGVSPDVQNDLIMCIDDVIKDQIDQEVKDCQFMSIQCDETTDVSTKEQLSIIIRIDRDGEIVERFLKFKNVSTDRSALAISDVVKDVLGQFGESIKLKVVMQTYDGAAVMSGHLGGVQTRVRQEYPYAFFFHCAAHRLNLVLCQSALNIKEVKLFFCKVAAFCTFTKQSSDRKAHLSSHGVDVPSPGETRWYYKSRAVSAIFNGYAALENALNEIKEAPQSWSDETVARADGLLQNLESFLFCFLLELYYKILQQSSILYDVLQNRSVDFAYGVKKIQDFGKFLKDDLRTDAAFEATYAAAEQRVGTPSRRSERNVNYRQVYFDVIDTIFEMVEDRFQDVESFSFLDLVNPKFFPQWQNGIPADKLAQLREKYGPLFDIANLQSQLMFVYRGQDFVKDTTMELLDYIYQVNIQACIPEVVKLLKLSGVMCVSSASAERSFSCMGRVKSYLRNSMADGRLGSLCRISIHKDILKEKEDKKQLHDLVLQKFVQSPRRLNFQYM